MSIHHRTLRSYTVPDLLWPAGLAVYVDGGIHDRPDRRHRDARLRNHLVAAGMEILVTTPEDILEDCDQVVRQIGFILCRRWARHVAAESADPAWADYVEPGWFTVFQSWEDYCSSRLQHLWNTRYHATEMRSDSTHRYADREWLRLQTLFRELDRRGILGRPRFRRLGLRNG